MSRLITISLTDAERASLEEGWRGGKSHAFRLRCRIILLKAQGQTAEQIAPQVDLCLMSVGKWVRRWQGGGLDGLRTRPGRGRKPLLTEEDLPAVRQAVEADRQRLSAAHAELAATLGRPISRTTLTRFLKNIAPGTGGSPAA